MTSPIRELNVAAAREHPQASHSDDGFHRELNRSSATQSPLGTPRARPDDASGLVPSLASPAPAWELSPLPELPLQGFSTAAFPSDRAQPHAQPAKSSPIYLAQVPGAQPIVDSMLLSGPPPRDPVFSPINLPKLPSATAKILVQAFRRGRPYGTRQELAVYLFVNGKSIDEVEHATRLPRDALDDLFQRTRETWGKADTFAESDLSRGAADNS